MFELWSTLSIGLGWIISKLFEKATFTWHGKKLKQYVFWFICVLAGGGIALGTKDITFTKLSWDTTLDVFASTAQILKWGIGFIVAGEAMFKKYVHQEDLTQKP